MVWAIYRIYCLDKDSHDSYIGCSTQFENRCKTHRRHVKKLFENVESNTAQYVHYNIAEQGGFDNWDIQIIHNCRNIKTRKELLELESMYIDKYKPTLNVVGNSKNYKYMYTQSYFYNVRLHIEEIIEFLCSEYGSFKKLKIGNFSQSVKDKIAEECSSVFIDNIADNYKTILSVLFKYKNYLFTD